MKVDIKNISNIVIGNNNVQTAKFGIDENNFQHITRLLSKGLYSNPIRTLMIEYVQNALDTHANINQTKKVEVTLPSTNYPFYKVQDFGEGMSPEFVLNKLTKYGSSTKSNTNSQVGGFGIGFKASTVYCDNFTMYVNYNGIRYIYDVTNCEGSGAITLLQQMETTKCNGTIIEIPVNVGDNAKFEDELQSGLYAKLYNHIIVYKDGKELSFEHDKWSQHIVDNEISYGYIKNWNHKTPPAVFLYSGNILITSLRLNWDLHDKIMDIFNTSSKLYFDEDEINCINKNQYTISLILRGSVDRYIQSYFYFNINVPIGKFEININRESFIYTDDFYMYILKKINDCVEYQIMYQDNLVKEITTESPTSDIIRAYQSFTITRTIDRTLDNVILNRLYYITHKGTLSFDSWVSECEKLNILSLQKYELSSFVCGHPYPKYEISYIYNYSYTFWEDVDTIFITSRSGTRNVHKLKKSLTDYINTHQCGVNILTNATGVDVTELQILYDVYKQLYPEKSVITDIKFNRVAAKQCQHTSTSLVDENTNLYGILCHHETYSTAHDYTVYNDRSGRTSKLSDISKILNHKVVLIATPKDKTHYTIDDIIAEVSKTKPILASILKYLHKVYVYRALHMSNILFVPEGWSSKSKKIPHTPITLSEYVANILNDKYKRDITHAEATLLVGFKCAAYYGVRSEICGYNINDNLKLDALNKFMQLLNITHQTIDIEYIHHIACEYSGSFNATDTNIVYRYFGVSDRCVRQIRELTHLQDCIRIPYTISQSVAEVLKQCICVIYNEVEKIS